MQIFDLSHPIEPTMQIYPGDPVFACHPAATVEKHGYNVTSLSMGSHTGTHLDAPYHFFEGGKKVDELPLEDLVGPAVVIRADRGGQQLEPRQPITWEELGRRDPESFQKLEKSARGVRIALIRTGWSVHWKTPQYLEHPFLERQVAEELLRRGVRVLGVDTLSPDETPAQEGEGSEGEGGFGVHDVLLREGAMIVENLRGLEELPDLEGRSLVASFLPLKIEGCDGSPIRAVAWVSEK